MPHCQCAVHGGNAPRLCYLTQQTKDTKDRALEAAKAFMGDGCGKLKDWAHADFSALMGVIDFCVGLDDADKRKWQPTADNDAVVGKVLQPARDARNRFAHNSRLAFDGEEDVSECIKALLALLELLPDAKGRTPPTRSSRNQARARLRGLLKRPDEETLKELNKMVSPVLGFMEGACQHDAAVVDGMMAQLSGQGAVRESESPATGGAGRAAGAGGEHDVALYQPAGSSSIDVAVQIRGGGAADTGRPGPVVGYDIAALTDQMAKLTTDDDRQAVARLCAACKHKVQTALARTKTLQACCKR